MTRRQQLKIAYRGRSAKARYNLIIVQEALRAGIPISLGYALIQTESNFRNVFGHDPTSSIPVAWKGGTVTKARYQYYKGRRTRHGMQGVGPAQLTWWATQDAADHIGGCRKPRYNIRIAFKTLASNIHAYGYAKGIERYNGSGPAAVHYSQIVRERAKHWHNVLTK